jgi:hypothetical protein
MNLIPVPGLARVGLDPPPHNLFLHAGRWTANCATCGFQLAEATRQARAERKAAGQTCPICSGGEAA